MLLTNSAETVTLKPGMVKVYLPLPLSVSFTVLPLASFTAMVSSSWPLSGVTVMVTVSPFLAVLGETVTSPFLVLVTDTAYQLPLLELEPPPEERCKVENVTVALVGDAS